MSWLSSNTIKVGVRERSIITFAGVAPDIDGLGLVIDPVSKLFGLPLNLWGEFHHQLHNLVFCILLMVIGYLMACQEKLKVALLVFLVFHLHLLCDLVGSKGPDGYQWPIPYLIPFSTDVQLTWQYQWELNAWPNIFLGVSLVIVMIIIARVKGRSPFEVFSSKMEAAFIGMVK